MCIEFPAPVEGFALLALIRTREQEQYAKDLHENR